MYTPARKINIPHILLIKLDHLLIFSRLISDTINPIRNIVNAKPNVYNNQFKPVYATLPPEIETVIKLKRYDP